MDCLINSFFFFFWFYADLPSWLDELKRRRRRWWFFFFSGTLKTFFFFFISTGCFFDLGGGGRAWSWFDSSVMSASIDLLFYSANLLYNWNGYGWGGQKEEWRILFLHNTFIDRRRLIHLKRITSRKKGKKKGRQHEAPCIAQNRTHVNGLLAPNGECVHICLFFLLLFKEILLYCVSRRLFL